MIKREVKNINMTNIDEITYQFRIFESWFF